MVCSLGEPRWDWLYTLRLSVYCPGLLCLYTEQVLDVNTRGPSTMGVGRVLRGWGEYWGGGESTENNISQHQWEAKILSASTNGKPRYYQRAPMGSQDIISDHQWKAKILSATISGKPRYYQQAPIGSQDIINEHQWEAKVFSVSTNGKPGYYQWAPMGATILSVSTNGSQDIISKHQWEPRY